MQRIQHRRDGFALAVAIGAIVVIGALIAGVFFASTQQFRIGRNTLLQTRALTAAESGLNALFDSTQSSIKWKAAWNVAPPGVKDTVVFTSPGVVDTVQLTKLNETNFLLVSEARAGSVLGAQARRRVGELVTLRIPQLKMHGAVTVGGSLKLAGNAKVGGADSTIANWNCPPPDTAFPGIAVADSTLINGNGSCGNLSCVTGNPAIKTDSAAAYDSTYFGYGDENWNTLTAMASKIATGGNPTPSALADGSCNTADPYNWGDPERLLPSGACNDYFPIIYAPGNLSLSGGTGQGILLIGGDLSVNGQFDFYGPVIIKGSLKQAGQAEFRGGLMAASATLGDPSQMTGNALVQYSSCALSRAINGSALPRPATLRSWVQLF